MSGVVDLSEGGGAAVYPQVIWNEDRYVVVWYEDGGAPFALYAATVAEDGTVITPAHAITKPPLGSRSRYPVPLPLGDRLLVVYSDTRDDNDGYELYSVMVDAELNPLSPEKRVTNAPTDSVEPTATFGPDGNVAILFRDDRVGTVHTFFTQLGCVTQ
jgi:hypothetical protein